MADEFVGILNSALKFPNIPQFLGGSRELERILDNDIANMKYVSVDDGDVSAVPILEIVIEAANLRPFFENYDIRLSCLNLIKSVFLKYRDSSFGDSMDILLPQLLQVLNKNASVSKYDHEIVEYCAICFELLINFFPSSKRMIIELGTPELLTIAIQSHVKSRVLVSKLCDLFALIIDDSDVPIHLDLNLVCFSVSSILSIHEPDEIALSSALHLAVSLARLDKVSLDIMMESNITEILFKYLSLELFNLTQVIMEFFLELSTVRRYCLLLLTKENNFLLDSLVVLGKLSAEILPRIATVWCEIVRNFSSVRALHNYLRSDAILSQILSSLAYQHHLALRIAACRAISGLSGDRTTAHKLVQMGVCARLMDTLTVVMEEVRHIHL